MKLPTKKLEDIVRETMFSLEGTAQRALDAT
jgi:hypothetical protein